MRECITTGKTVDEAMKKAKEELGIVDEETGFEILQMPHRSFFGLKNTPAKVRVYVVEEEPKERPEDKRTAPKPADKKITGEKKREPASIREGMPKEAKAPAERLQRNEKPEKKNDRPRPSRPEKEPKKERPAKVEEQPFVPTPVEEQSEKAKLAVQYVADILTAMGVKNAVVTAHESKESIDIMLEGDGLGVIIGRRGETLDSVQYLTSLVANRLDGEYVRISIDSGDYRKKRAETLERLAQKLARNAVKTGRSTKLEPMNPYERRIIHAAVSKVEGATSSSVGEEPNRRVVISSKNPKKREGAREGREGGRPPRRGGKDGQRTPRPSRAASSVKQPTERIRDDEIEIPEELAPKDLPPVQPVVKATHEVNTPTLEEKEVLPLYGKLDL